MDLDDADATTRTADGTLTRDRIAVKRQIDMTFNPLPWAKASALLKSIAPEFVDVYYPDPQDGQHVTRTFYVGNRPAPVAIDKGGGVMYWGQIKFTLTEQ